MRIALLWTAVIGLFVGGCAPAGEAPQIEGAELAAMLAEENIFLLDVREPSELEELGTVEGYVNIPIDQLEGRLDELPRDKPILTA